MNIIIIDYYGLFHSNIYIVEGTQGDYLRLATDITMKLRIWPWRIRQPFDYHVCSYCQASRYKNVKLLEQRS